VQAVGNLLIHQSAGNECQHLDLACREFVLRALTVRDLGDCLKALCLPCYIISFAQMALPISTAMKGVLWFVFFGLAKTFQYGGLAILGAKGLSEAFKKEKKGEDNSES